MATLTYTNKKAMVQTVMSLTYRRSALRQLRVLHLPRFILAYPTASNTPIQVGMGFSCRSRGCKQTYDTAGGLANHRRACVAYKVHEKKSLLRRQRTLLAKSQVRITLAVQLKILAQVQ